MILRLVKLTFHPENTDAFQEFFAEFRNAIRNSEGCLHLEAWRGLDQPNVFFTFSKWETTADLEAYRHSETFKAVWPKTKALFSARPEAWTVEQL